MGRQKLSDSVNIDGEAIKKYCKEKHIKITKLSEDMGYQRDYVSKAMYLGYMVTPAYKLMCMLMKVDEKTFVKKSETVEVAPTPNNKVSKEVAEQLVALNTKLDTLIEILRGDIVINSQIFEEVGAIKNELVPKTEKKVEDKKGGNIHVTIQPEQLPPTYVKPQYRR